MLKKVYVIAGESSGDIICSALMSALTRINKQHIDFRGIGGNLMLKNGLKESFFPMEDISLMGISEILPKIMKLNEKINETVDDIIAFDPDVLITVDSPDFCFRVASRLRKKADKHPVMIHHVAPSVWAWRAGRAKKIAKFLDGIICLFPFEPSYFRKENLAAVFSGHPVMESDYKQARNSQYRKEKSIPENATVIGMLPGSRKSEIERTGRILYDAIGLFSRNSGIGKIHIPILTHPHLESLVRESFPSLDEVKIHIETDQSKKWQLFGACDFAVATSGTVGLELAVADVPHLIAYKVNRITAFIVKTLIKVKYAHLANIILDRECVPEFIQEKCKSEDISNCIYKMMNESESYLAEQKNDFQKVRDEIGGKSEQTSSDRAASFIYSCLNK